MKTKSRKLLLCALLVSLPLLPVSCCTASTPTAESSETVVMPRATYVRLKLLVAEQATDCATLRARLTRLETSSGEQSEELQRLVSRAETLQSQLTIADERLESASTSLTDAMREIESLQKSLTDLKKDLRDLEHKLKVARRQRDTYAGALALVAGGWIADKTGII